MLTNADVLPLEIWCRVFFWATFTPIRQASRDTPSIPLFDALTFKDSGSEQLTYSNALFIKCVLSLVSKRWQELSREFLFEDIRIRHGAASLADQLEASRDDSQGSLGLGRHVRRVVLPRANAGDVVVRGRSKGDRERDALVRRNRKLHNHPKTVV